MHRFDPAPRLPKTSSERWILGGFVAVVVSLFAAELASGDEPARLSVLFVLLSWIPLLVLHESGHALVAWMLGWRVNEVVIGVGRELARFRLGGTLVRLHAAPLAGYVFPSPRDSRGASARSAAIFAAGPGIELAFVALCWAVLGDALVARSHEIGTIAVQSACVVAVYGAVANLFPYALGAGRISDGMGIIASLRGGDSSFATHLAAPYLDTARRALYREDLAGARHAIEAGLAEVPGDPQLRSLDAVCVALGGDTHRALEMLEDLGPPTELAQRRKPGGAGRPGGARDDVAEISAASVELSIDTATVLLAHDAEGALVHAHHAARRAHALAPDWVRTQLLLGRTTLARGRFAEAYQILMDAYKVSRDRDEEAQLVAYLAIACHYLDNADYAARFAREAAQAPIGPALAERVRIALSR